MEDTSYLPDIGDSNTPSMPHITVTQKGVEKLLSNLVEHKAAGPDAISPRLLKHLSSVISPALTKIYQLSIDTGAVPKDWRGASIVPVFKKGDKSKAANYRPVSLTAICCKMLEHILCSNIMSHLSDQIANMDSEHDDLANPSS